MRRPLILAGVLAIVSLAAVWWFVKGMTVDGCHDNGGRWNDRTNACESPVPADRPRG